MKHDLDHLIKRNKTLVELAEIRAKQVKQARQEVREYFGIILELKDTLAVRDQEIRDLQAVLGKELSE